MQRIIALLLLLLISPFLGVIFFIVKLTSRGSFVFRQKRAGKDRKIFTIYKIRTMTEEAEKIKNKFKYLNEADGPVFKIKNDPRFTRFGKILASIGMDEVLQLVNIIKGEMNFIGPRPLPVEEALKVPRIYHNRFTVKPGISSLWVIRGAHRLSFNEWMESDIEYLRRRNIFLDIYIAISTILSIIRWSIDQMFIVFFALVLVFYAISPDSIWWFQIFTFFSVFLLLGLDFRRKFSLSYLILIILLSVSTFFSINTISSVPRLIAYLQFFLISQSFIENKKEIFLKGFVAGTFIMGLLSALYTSSKTFFGALPSILYFLDSPTNLIIPFFGYAFYAVFLVATFPYVIEKVIDKKSILWKIIFICFNLFFFLSFSKIAIFIGFIEILLMVRFRLNSKKLLDKIKILIPGVLMISVFILLIGFSLPKNNWLSKKIYKQSILTRLEYLDQIKQIVSNSSPMRVFIGYGLDNYFELSNHYQTKAGLWTMFAHNYFVQFFIENGGIALIIFLFIIYYFIRKNYIYYDTFEKITLIVLLLYSLGSTYDLHTLPIFLLFLVLLNKNSEKDNIPIRFAIIVRLLMVIILLFFWLRFLIIYPSFFFFNQPSLDKINTFPYDTSFWKLAIGNKKNNAEELLSIKNKLNIYSRSNIDLEKDILLRLSLIENSCNTLSLSKSYLLKSPLDIEAQQILIDSSSNCHDNKIANMKGFIAQSKIYYDKAQLIDSLRPLIYYFAINNYKFNQWNDYKYWMDKAWKIEVDNNTDDYKEIFYRNEELAFPIRKPIIIKINMKVIDGISGIALYSHVSPLGSPWWTRPKFFIGIKDQGTVLFVDLYDGINITSNTLFDAKITEVDGIWQFYFDSKGKNLKIYNSADKLIKEINVNRITGGKFQNGFFINNNIYLGYIVGPNSHLSISDFLVLPQ